MAFHDSNRRSRQLAVYGHETMHKIFNSKVLVSGMNGLGAEIAKNLILAGMKYVTVHDERTAEVHDERTVELWDLSSNLIFTEKDMGKNRGVASLLKLLELNNDVYVSTLQRLTKKQL